MLPPSGAWVNAYQRIARGVGSLFHVARESIWFDPTTFAVSDNATDGRTEVRAAADTGLRPLIVPVQLIAVAAGVQSRQIVAFANDGYPSTLTNVAVWPDDPVVANNTHHAKLSFYEARPDGTMLGSVLATATTQTYDLALRPYGTGSWIAGELAFTVGIGHDIAAGNSVRVFIESIGAGVAVPSMWLRVT